MPDRTCTFKRQIALISEAQFKYATVNGLVANNMMGAAGAFGNQNAGAAYRQAPGQNDVEARSKR